MWSLFVGTPRVFAAEASDALVLESLSMKGLLGRSAWAAASRDGLEYQ